MRQILPLILWFAAFLCASPVVASSPARDEETSRAPADYKSAHFILRTDLDREAAEELLTRLEAMLKIVSRYWGANSTKVIACHVVDNPANWPDGTLPPDVISQVRHGGITLAQGVRRGRQLDMTAVVCASSKSGTPLHEAVHAYCLRCRTLPPELEGEIS